MQIFVPLQSDPGETRTPITPAVVKKLVAKGVAVAFQSGVGKTSFITDTDYTDAGATLADDQWAEADVVLTVSPPSQDDVRRMKRDSALIGLLSPTLELDLVKACAESGVSSVSLEFVPRISRAQSMDVLSSQANLGGYKAVLMGADHCPKLMPMMITAAGTLAPGRVLVVGVGVAGLQAIATAKRLGAIVEAYDVRPATKEQVQSLGARFVELPGSGGGETAGGYAKEQTDEERQKQAELMAKHVTGADIVITTAALFGKAPPLLVPADVVRKMRNGSVLVDLAANPAYGHGNCELTKPGEVATVQTDEGGSVTLIGTTNLPGLMPVHASQVFANNVMALLDTLLITPEAQGEDTPEQPAAPSLTFDLEDEIHQGALITHDGEVVNELVKEKLGASD